MAKFTKQDMKMFDLARRCANDSDYKSFHLGCVISYKGKVISTGHNSNKSNPIQKKYNRKYRSFRYNGKPIHDSLHAEMAALINIPKCVDVNLDYSKIKVYIYRICPGKRLKMGNACSCEACMAALRDKGVRHLYYTDDDGFVYKELY